MNDETSIISLHQPELLRDPDTGELVRSPEEFQRNRKHIGKDSKDLQLNIPTSIPTGEDI